MVTNSSYISLEKIHKSLKDLLSSSSRSVRAAWRHRAADLSCTLAKARNQHSSAYLKKVRRLLLREAASLRAAVDSDSADATTAPPVEPPPQERRLCSRLVQAERIACLQAEMRASGMRLRTTSALDEPVLIDGPPVFLDWPKRRSPSCFRTAQRYIKGVAVAQSRSQHTGIHHRYCEPTGINLLAERAPGDGSRADPLKCEWSQVTEGNLWAAATQANAGYVQVYYGGKHAAALVAAARARLPPNLALRGHSRSLIVFASLDNTTSSTHLDETASVLVCMSAEARRVWIAPNRVAAECGLHTVEGYPHVLAYDPFADEDRSWLWEPVELACGQALFIPRGWWHCVHGAAGSLALSFDVHVS